MEPPKSGDSSQSQGCTRMFKAVLSGESRRPLTRAEKDTHTRCHGDAGGLRSKVVAVCREGRVAREMLTLSLLIFSKLW